VLDHTHSHVGLFLKAVLKLVHIPHFAQVIHANEDILVDG
jgi:hypothetical protein